MRGSVFHCFERGDQWIVMAIIYFDTYERQGGRWYFVRRSEQHWYSADVLERPSAPDFQQWAAEQIANIFEIFLVLLAIR